MTAVRDLRIDGVAQQLSAVGGLLVAHDGSIAVLQPADSKVRFFDVHGKALGDFGRDGAGPNEFHGIGRHGWYGDTLWFYDVGNSRTMFIYPGRKQSRTVPTRMTATLPGAEGVVLTFAGPVGYSGDGTRIVHGMIRFGATLPDWLPKQVATGDDVWFLESPTGKFLRLLAWESQSTCRGIVPGVCRMTTAIASDGHAIAMTRVEEQTSAISTYRVTRLNARGDTTFSRIHSAATLAFTKQMGDSFARTAARGGPTEPHHWQFPDMFPPVKRILPGEDETTWIEVASLTHHDWRVLNARGDMIGQLRLPLNVRIEVADRGTIWTSEADDDGIQSIGRYRVH